LIYSLLSNPKEQHVAKVPSAGLFKYVLRKFFELNYCGSVDNAKVLRKRYGIITCCSGLDCYSECRM